MPITRHIRINIVLCYIRVDIGICNVPVFMCEELILILECVDLFSRILVWAATTHGKYNLINI